MSNQPVPRQSTARALTAAVPTARRIAAVQSVLHGGTTAQRGGGDPAHVDRPTGNDRGERGGIPPPPARPPPPPAPARRRMAHTSGNAATVLTPPPLCGNIVSIGRMGRPGETETTVITFESDRTAGAVQTLAAQVLGYQVGVSQAGRLGTEIAFTSLAPETVRALRAALRAGGHRVYVTRGR